MAENLSIYVHNVHCKQIIFGASADNGYASFVSSLLIDKDVSSRIRVLKGPPFSLEFGSILTKLKWTEFRHIFRSDMISSNDPVAYRVRRMSQEFEQPQNQDSWSKTASYPTAMVYRSRANRDNDRESSDALDEQRGDPLAELSSSSSSQTTMPRPRTGATAAAIEATLISCTNERLTLSPKALDFGVVKQSVEQILGLPPDFWGKSENDEWFLKSKNIIKMAVVSYCCMCS